MKCPYCGYEESKVIDSRDSNDSIRRRRECIKCEGRFTTYEHINPITVHVIKKDLRREEFSRAKLLSGINKACDKRPIQASEIEKIADEIENSLLRQGKNEISTTEIGDMVMQKLKALDSVAYIRFASVYRQFADITELKAELENIINNEK
ncbi:MAG: transcriptional repressor NrdR [Dehalococcoidales bacterium]|jgi:transcriptional repressor NrdR|nr:transcriptional repressor NrdR [Dehalococcoidales bacterium]